MGLAPSRNLTPSQMAAQVLEGNRLALARVLTQVENGTPEGREALNILFPHTGQAHLIGVTGAPGTGKSSLVNKLARYYRQAADSSTRKIAVVAVDPTSPFSGGAILGDRVRMRDLSGDSGVFIRSMASRGELGGLATATSGFAQALDAAGFEIILIETVGAGQAEVDIARLAHTTLVVEAPGLGDDIQAIKAGILEIADILVINKADRPGVETTERALRSMLQLAHPTHRELRHHRSLETVENPRGEDQAKAWETPIVKTVATEGVGISDLGAAIEAHRKYLLETGDWQRRDQLRLQSELEAHIQQELLARWRASLPDASYQEVLSALLERKISPHEAVLRLADDQKP